MNDGISLQVIACLWNDLDLSNGTLNPTNSTVYSQITEIRPIFDVDAVATVVHYGSVQQVYVVEMNVTDEIILYL